MFATPLKSFGSTSPPFFIKSCAVTSGKFCRSTTITRSPFLSVRSTGLGIVAERGAAGGGGVSRWASVLLVSIEVRQTKLRINKKIFLFIYAFSRASWKKDRRNKATQFLPLPLIFLLLTPFIFAH